MNNFSFWQKWLTWANVLGLIIGLLVAFFPFSIFFDLHHSKTQDVFFEGQAMPENIRLLIRWLFGIIGGTIAGYHLLMIYVSEYAFSLKQKWAWRACLYSIIAWFLIDSSLSIYFGAIHNVYLINLAGLVMILLPLINTRKYFFR